jgi:hypothetical protein
VAIRLTGRGKPDPVAEAIGWLNTSRSAGPSERRGRIHTLAYAKPAQEGEEDDGDGEYLVDAAGKRLDGDAAIQVCCCLSHDQPLSPLLFDLAALALEFWCL